MPSDSDKISAQLPLPSNALIEPIRTLIRKELKRPVPRPVESCTDAMSSIAEIRSNAMRMLRLAVGVTLFVMCACSHTVTTTSIVRVRRVPEVAPVATLETISVASVDVFVKAHAEAGFCVYKGAVYMLYWRDELKTDSLLLLPTTNGYDVMKVEAIGEKLLREENGTRNGKVFQQTTIQEVR